MDKNKVFMNFLVKRYFKDESKVSVLQSLFRGETKMKAIAFKLGMSEPLVSFHLNGNPKTPGLIEMGLVNKVWDKPDKMTKASFVISDLGKDVLKILKRDF